MYDKPSMKTLIIYNYASNDTATFEFYTPGFTMKDELVIDPPKGKIEPGKHMIIKLKLIPKSYLSCYEGELEIKVTWTSTGNRDTDKDSLFVRIIKKINISEVNIK
jgi:hypothetical protein